MQILEEFFISWNTKMKTYSTKGKNDFKIWLISCKLLHFYRTRNDGHAVK